MVARYVRVGLDVFGIVLATMLALILREDLRIPWHRILETLPYMISTLAVALSVFIIAGARHPLPQRYKFNEGVYLALLIMLIVAGALGVTFAYNRLDGVVRSLPVLQYLIATALLISHRLIRQTRQRMNHRRRIARAKQASGRQDTAGTLIIGQTHLAEAYVLALQDFEHEPSAQSVVGVLRTQSCSGDFATWRSPILGPLYETVLGATQDINDIITELEVHGVEIKRAVIARRWSDLSAGERAELTKAQSESRIQLEFLTVNFGLEDPQSHAARRSEDAATYVVSANRKSPLEAGRRPHTRQLFWQLKRAFDVSFALLLLVLLSPAMACTALLVWSDVGCPIMFWQQRPGRNGRTFRLYKMRTMRLAFSQDASRIPDHKRSSSIGRFLRRFRLDELPQLFNILAGEMSFVGPRPLLRGDQPKQSFERLSVRPGLTGWAQVHCVRDTNVADKLALDLWYIQNASFTLDLLILAKTIPVMLFGERNDNAVMMRCSRDLENLGGGDHVD